MDRTASGALCGRACGVISCGLPSRGAPALLSCHEFLSLPLCMLSSRQSSALHDGPARIAMPTAPRGCGRHALRHCGRRWGHWSAALVSEQPERRSSARMTMLEACAGPAFVHWRCENPLFSFQARPVPLHRLRIDAFAVTFHPFTASCERHCWCFRSPPWLP